MLLLHRLVEAIFASEGLNGSFSELFYGHWCHMEGAFENLRMSAFSTNTLFIDDESLRRFL